MTASCIPRNHYLMVHDALRKVVGTEATLAAFVKHKHQYQCDMLVNSRMTDIERLREASEAMCHPFIRNSKHMETEQYNYCITDNFYNNNDSSTTTSNNNIINNIDRVNRKSEQANLALSAFNNALQQELPLCVIVPHTRRLDITFSDYNVIQLALGADLKDINNLESTSEIDKEKDWWKRNRLRISLGFDEELFIEHSTRIVRQAAIKIDRIVRKKYEKEVHEALDSEECRKVLRKYNNNYNAVTPPFTYWLAHCYSANASYEPERMEKLIDIVLSKYKEYYGVFAFDNPYCPGEDLNSMNVVRWLCNTECSEYTVDATSVLRLLNTDELEQESEESELREQRETGYI